MVGTYTGVLILTFFIIEPRLLCSHCPYYEKEGKVLKCWALRGMPKLWKYAAVTQWVFDSIFLLGLIIILKSWFFNTAIPLAAWFMLSDLPFGAVNNAVRYSMFRKAMDFYRDQMKSSCWIHVFLHPLSSFVMNLSLIKSCFKKRITWRRIEYNVKSAFENLVALVPGTG